MSETVIEVFALRAAVEALVSGDAVVSDDGNQITWDEPDCGLGMDRLVGVERTDEGGWRPMVEAAVVA